MIISDRELFIRVYNEDAVKDDKTEHNVTPERCWAIKAIKTCMNASANKVRCSITVARRREQAAEKKE